MTDAEKLKKLQCKPTRQCSHATSFVTPINTSDSSTAFKELENYSDRLQVDLQNLISPNNCIRDLLDVTSTCKEALGHPQVDEEGINTILPF